MAFNGHMNSTSIYPWPKILASLYVITAIYFYLDLRKIPRGLRSLNLLLVGA
ncbi:MAG UNVERIFIED_CONTAM: hypothetical protein LVR29_34595 [Microcystis novacekii LVE1205-3]